MIHLALIFSILVAAVAQGMLPAWGTLGEAKTPIVLGVVMYYALNRTHGLMLLAGGIGGIVLDCIGNTPLGFSSFYFCVIGLFLNQFRGKLFGSRWITQAWLGTLCGGLMIPVSFVVLVTLGRLPLLALETSAPQAGRYHAAVGAFSSDHLSTRGAAR